MTRTRIARDGLLVLGLAIGAAQALGLSPTPVDGDIYWRATIDALYPSHAWDPGLSGYLYPPPMAQLLAPIHAVGYGIFTIALTTALFGALWYCAGIWAWAFVATGALRAFLPVLPDELSIVLGYAMNGNVQLFIAAGIVASLRHPSAWGIALLTKTGPGVGVLWYAFRREWGPLAKALGATAAIAGASFLIAPDLWFQWIGFLTTNAGQASPIPLVPVPFGIRVAMAIALLAWAAPRNHRWALPIAAGWAIPALYAGTFLGVWVGAIALARPEGRARG